MPNIGEKEKHARELAIWRIDGVLLYIAVHCCTLLYRSREIVCERDLDAIHTDVSAWALHLSKVSARDDDARTSCWNAALLSVMRAFVLCRAAMERQ